MLKLFTLFIVLAGSAVAAPVDEIEALLAYVAKLEGSFIRNGDAHTPAEAVAHLRMKWKSQKEQVHSAEDFIRLCATKSTASGKAYAIRFSDGREEEAARVLLRQLKIIRGTSAFRSGQEGRKPEARGQISAASNGSPPTFTSGRGR